jgi:DNA-directed RNA polymerase subunit RPC12/RpoP
MINTDLCPNCGRLVDGQVTEFKHDQVAEWRCPECGHRHRPLITAPS